ncbi:hypothetical protein [Azohydromonas sp.]|uniref:hypothetical protein n=1 Tax=Azohydromonas sp. TaxID=1872666 RepID=UPI002BC73D0E|nr:hypothetical protein [Azohydromonas sp.]HMM85033.1 hypothetical protein [Azohydromonas sp.]
MAPHPQSPPETPETTRRASRSALVDTLLGAIAALPVIAVLIGSGDLFVAVAALLPVAVMAVCSLDPPDIAQLAARLRDQRRR